MEEPGGLQSMGSHRVGHDWATSLSLFTFHFHALEKEMATHSSVLAWRIPGTGEPRGLPSMGSHRVGHDWNDLAAAAAGYYTHPWLCTAITGDALNMLSLGSTLRILVCWAQGGACVSSQGSGHGWGGEGWAGGGGGDGLDVRGGWEALLLWKPNHRLMRRIYN